MSSSFARHIHVISLLAVLLPVVPATAGDTVVIYTALDEMYSRPILDGFEAASGLTVKAVYDTEASKTTGLVNRLIAERDRPRADVFWNNEVAQTIVLKKKGVLVPHESPAAGAIPASFKDPEGYWTGFAARARVIIYNTDLVKDPPASILDLLDPQWKGKAAIAKPLFGTTSTHAAALFAVWGEDRAKTYFLNVLKNDIAVLPGNATVRDLVARGEYAWGLTDTDDANGAVVDGFPAKWLLPDQQEGGLGTLLIPNSLALIKGGPNPEGGRALIDYLLKPEIEQRLSEGRSLQIPVNPAVKAPEGVPVPSRVRTMKVTFEAAADAMPDSAAFIREEFLR